MSSKKKIRTVPTNKKTVPQSKKKKQETGTIDAQQIYTDGNISEDNLCWIWSYLGSLWLGSLSSWFGSARYTNELEAQLGSARLTARAGSFGS